MTRLTQPASLSLALALAFGACGPAVAAAAPSRTHAAKPAVRATHRVRSLGEPLERPPVTTPLTAREAPLGFAEVVVTARENSLAAQSSRATLASNQFDREAVFAGALPTLGVQSSANYSNLPSSAAAVFGGPFGQLNLVGFPQQGTYVDTTIAASWTLFDAFATRDALAIADQTLRIDRLALYQAQQDAMLNAAVAYFDVLRTEGLAKVASDTTRQAQEHLRLGNVRLSAGAGTRAEVLALRSQLALAQASLGQARNAVNVARLNLANALNAPVGDRPLEAQPGVPPLDVSLSRDLMPSLGRRPEIAQAQVRQTIDEARAGLEGKALLPTVAGAASYSLRGLHEGLFTTGATVRWNLFDGFKARNREASARALAQADRVALEQARQRIALEIRQQYEAREEAGTRVSSTKEALTSASEAYRLSVDRFQLGMGTLSEITDAQNTLISAGNAYVSATNDLRAAEIRLARGLGIDLGQYLAHQPTPAAR